MREEVERLFSRAYVCVSLLFTICSYGVNSDIHTYARAHTHYAQICVRVYACLCTLRSKISRTNQYSKSP
jgi:hypothetical protein